MANTITELTVFISCPSNLADLRGVAEAAIDEVSETLRVTANIRLICISWADDIVPGVANDAQEVINQQTLKKYDIYLGMIGSRFGTGTPRAGSGTEEEFDLAFDQFRSDPCSIRILFYLKAFGVSPFDIDPSELEKVLVFRAKLKAQGVLYKELSHLDDALASVKNHILKLITSEWDATNKRWKVPVIGTISKSVINLEANPSISNELAPMSSAGKNPPDEDLGLLDLQIVALQEFELAGDSIAKLGANLDLLTSKTSEKFDDSKLSPSVGHVGLQAVIDAYASDINEFVSNSRGELENARFHLSNGADHIEAFYKQMQLLDMKPSESPADLISTVDVIEPNLRMFRSSVLFAKQVVGKLPPMTKRFKISQRNLVALFDQIALEMTLSLERLSLLKSRLGDRH